MNLSVNQAIENHSEINPFDAIMLADHTSDAIEDIEFIPVYNPHLDFFISGRLPLGAALDEIIDQESVRTNKFQNPCGELEFNW